MKKKNRLWIFLVLRTLANTLIIGGIIFAFLSFWPFVQQEVWYWWNNSVVKSESPVQEPEVIAQTKETQLPPLKVKPKNQSYGIVIEKINVNAPVVANVDAGSYSEYIAALSKGVAHAKGTAFPGSTKADNNNVFLFAHSAINAVQARRYNSVFTLLRKLEKGDRVTTFYQGKRFDYIVNDNKVVQAEDIQYLTDPSKKPILTLQTCDPPGTNLRRLIITADLVQ